MFGDFEACRKQKGQLPKMGFIVEGGNCNLLRATQILGVEELLKSPLAC